GDLVARLGGDEFSLLLQNIRNPQQLKELAGRLIHAVSEPIALAEIEVKVGVSIGIARFPTDAVQAKELISCADRALYQAKAAGRNTWRFASESGTALSLQPED
ncbi:MAG: GGDEF domain-containing protein, partial [Porticoccaceae bacterium]|nr:GGDEF domain-containing protein [Porticoccaceae bacterium]